jgi:hypothetical protein
LGQTRTDGAWRNCWQVGGGCQGDTDLRRLSAAAATAAPVAVVSVLLPLHALLLLPQALLVVSESLLGALSAWEVALKVLGIPADKTAARLGIEEERVLALQRKAAGSNAAEAAHASAAHAAHAAHAGTTHTSAQTAKSSGPGESTSAPAERPAAAAENPTSGGRAGLSAGRAGAASSKALRQGRRGEDAHPNHQPDPKGVAYHRYLQTWHRLVACFPQVCHRLPACQAMAQATL